MANNAGKAYGLTVLSPIKRGGKGDQSFKSLTREYLQELQMDKSDEKSPMAKVPNTYLCRFFLLANVNYQGKPAELDSLKSPYLVFVAEIHGDRDTYLRGMWTHATQMIQDIWEHCVGFGRVSSADDFIEYVKKCQVKTTLYFNGSTDDPLAEQLKALYLKQEFSRFAFAAAKNKDSAKLQKDFEEFVARTQPDDLTGPTWRAGASSLKNVVIPDGSNKP